MVGKNVFVVFWGPIENDFQFTKNTILHLKETNHKVILNYNVFLPVKIKTSPFLEFFLKIMILDYLKKPHYLGGVPDVYAQCTHKGQSIRISLQIFFYNFHST
jgi:hypothetical protein